MPIKKKYEELVIVLNTLRTRCSRNLLNLLSNFTYRKKPNEVGRLLLITQKNIKEHFDRNFFFFFNAYIINYET